MAEDPTHNAGLFKGPEPGSARDPSGLRRRRPLFWLGLSFCAGIAFDALLQPSLPWLGGACLALVLVAVGVMVQGPNRRQDWDLRSMPSMASV